ncbi:hypothetical protein AAZX31_13G316600 [Glycine max]
MVFPHKHCKVQKEQCGPKKLTHILEDRTTLLGVPKFTWN